MTTTTTWSELVDLVASVPGPAWQAVVLVVLSCACVRVAGQMGRDAERGLIGW